MDSTHSLSSFGQVVAVSRSDRWQVYQRLQELGIPCGCSGDGHLRADISTPHLAIQLWSVVRQFTTPRQQLVDWLEQSW
ncbi:MAG: hypothetical protein HC881_01445 [Leptolyngbyaceae cyanobacterium SL_7_1]|nr:hypothetical protein [Leptolyngbyaceae cyanobacterium SL_7_1]